MNSLNNPFKLFDDFTEQSCIRGIVYGIVNNGKVAEWFNAPVLKTGVVVGLPRVRLPLFPLYLEIKNKTTCVLINNGDS